MIIKNIISMSRLSSSWSQIYEYCRVSWGNSDQNFKISFCFYSLSFISRCEEVILGPHLDQSVLYQLMKESPKKHVLRKSNNQNTKSSVELIRMSHIHNSLISHPTAKIVPREREEET